MKGKKLTAALGRTGKYLFVMAALLVATLAAHPASATPLTTPVKPLPDITADGISVQYIADKHTLLASGWVETLMRSGKDGIEIESLTDYQFSLEAVVDDNGASSWGILDLYNMYNPSDHFLTGRLAAMGFEAGDPTMQFLFNLDGPSIFGSQALVTLSYSGFNTAANGFAGDWDNGTVGNAMADINAPVPEPGTVSLLLLGAGGLVLYRRRKSAHNA